jgi:hypothetical protein
MALDKFIAKWSSSHYPPVRVDEAEFDLVEAQFQFKLPLDYRSEVLRAGLPRLTASLLHSVVEANSDVHAVSEFFDPMSMIKSTNTWRKMGLSSSLVAFASDDMGNLFCFDGSQKKNEASAVWFFDHDFETNEPIASSFTAWIEKFCDINFIDFTDE